MLFICRVMTYNILADQYADSDFSRQQLFPQCPLFAMGKFSIFNSSKVQ